MMKRRQFIAGLGSAAAWPVVARAQRPSATVIGYLTSGSSEGADTGLAGLRKGLSESGYVEGRNLTIEYRWANSEFGTIAGISERLGRPASRRHSRG
jgi:putative ABC transport system substrate-binding protein